MALSRPTYAYIKNAFITDIIEHRCRYSSQADAEDAILRLRDRVTFSRMSQESGIPTLYISGFALEKHEIEQGFRGNFAQVLIVPHDADFVLYLKKLEVPLAKHPDRPQVKHVGGSPNWGHPFLRTVKKRRLYFDSIDLARSELDRLEHDYRSAKRLSDSSLAILVYSRGREDGASKPEPKFEQAKLRIGYDEDSRKHYIFCEYKPHTVADRPHKEAITESNDNEARCLSKFIFRNDGDPYLAASKILLDVSRTKEGRTDYKLQTNDSRSLIDPDPCVYHFTSQQGLEGILGTHTIWLTDLRFMNDKSEMRHGAEFAYDAVKEFLQTRRTTELQAQDDLSSRIEVDLLKAYRNLAAGSLHRQLFASCFTVEVEQAGTWQTYGLNGLGYALGFRHRFLKRLLQPDIFQYRRVFYHKDRKSAIINEFMSRSLATLNAFYNETATADSGLNFWIDALSYFGSIFKHTSWYHEKEWRLMLSRRPDDDSTLKLESRKKTIAGLPAPMPIAYIERKVPDIFACSVQELVKEVVIGPGQYAHERSNSVQLLLDQNGLSQISVRISDVPLSSY